jgi:uncharacterized low-complexity protein
MKKLLGIAALLFAFAPFAQAQDASDILASHPDARNDRATVEAAAPAKHGEHRKAHHKAAKAKAKAAEAKDAAKEAAPK